MQNSEYFVSKQEAERTQKVIRKTIQKLAEGGGESLIVDGHDKGNSQSNDNSITLNKDEIIQRYQQPEQALPVIDQQIVLQEAPEVPMERITANLQDYGIFEKFEGEKSQASKLALVNFNKIEASEDDHLNLQESMFPKSNSRMNYLILMQMVLTNARKRRHQKLIELVQNMKSQKRGRGRSKDKQ